MDQTSSNRSNILARIAIVVALVAMITEIYSHVFSSHESSVSTTAGSTLERVRSSGTFAAAVVSAPPVSSINPTTGEAQGYAVDVIKRVAERANLKVKFIPADWATMNAALITQQVDVIVGPVFLAEGRAKEFLFTDPLLAYAIVAVVKAETTNFDRSSLQRPGIRIAVGRGGFDQEFVTKFMPSAETKVFPPDDANLPLLEVVSGRADVALADFATASRFVRENPSVKMVFSDEPLSLQFAGYMVRSADSSWAQLLNVALRNMTLSGELDNIDNQYKATRTWYGVVHSAWSLVR
jgi:ABC-type amino acid transport substrate-binding protein